MNIFNNKKHVFHFNLSSIFSLSGDDPLFLWVIGTTVLITAVYWLFGSVYILFDLTNRPLWLRKYKTQPGTNEPLNLQRLSTVIATVLFNQFAVGIPLTLFAYRALQARGLQPIHELPNPFRSLADIVICIFVQEIGFYYSHRLLHVGWLYRWIHKRHHEWTAPIAVTAIYCHPVEHVLSNLLPPFGGVLLTGCHLTTAWAWFTLAIVSTLNSHCGYHMPLLASPEAHDYHHLK